jgi:hypothetical protein
LGKYGRPKLKPHERRDASTLNVRLNKVEREIVKEKAAQAGVTLHEWARLAALEQDPPIRPIVPELNYEAWRETAKLLSTLKGAIWRFQPGMEEALRLTLESTREELTVVRKLLLGGKP